MLVVFLRHPHICLSSSVPGFHCVYPTAHSFDRFIDLYVFVILDIFFLFFTA